jgi:alkanesulfonate monooxygenase SsuD/methylene tetrahydromethanopterin reductase-like flavin-dependent oxidoreductase (luciferase family)
LPFAKRGAVADECLHVIHQALEEGEVNFQGNFYKLAGVRMQLRPIQRPRPPVWIGGNGPQAAARAARVRGLLDSNRLYG